MCHRPILHAIHTNNVKDFVYFEYSFLKIWAEYFPFLQLRSTRDYSKIHNPQVVQHTVSATCRTYMPENWGTQFQNCTFLCRKEQYHFLIINKLVFLISVNSFIYSILLNPISKSFSLCHINRFVVWWLQKENKVVSEYATELGQYWSSCTFDCWKVLELLIHLFINKKVLSWTNPENLVHYIAENTFLTFSIPFPL